MGLVFPGVADPAEYLDAFVHARDRRVDGQHGCHARGELALAAARQVGFSYSRLIEKLTKAGVEIDRKIMAELAVLDPKGFEAIASVAKSA